jgi:hypothetical protein
MRPNEDRASTLLSLATLDRLRGPGTSGEGARDDKKTASSFVSEAGRDLETFRARSELARVNAREPEFSVHSEFFLKSLLGLIGLQAALASRWSLNSGPAGKNCTSSDR